MSTDIATAAEFHLTDWWDKNKQRVVYATGAIAVIALVGSFIFWNKNQKEMNASEALSNIQPGAGAPAAYLKVATDFAGTAAAERAVLLAASVAYADGNYGEAQSTFERFLREFPESPSRVTVLLGVASCLDAQGKATEAAAKYQDIVQRYGTDPAAMPAKSALARLYEAQNQFAPAATLYQDLSRNGQNTSYGLESMVRLQNLVAKHPELLKSVSTNAAVKLP